MRFKKVISSLCAVSAALFVLASCQSPLIGRASGNTGSVSLTIAVPASMTAPAVKLLRSAESSSRLINPGTKLIDISITGQDVTPVSDSVPLADGQTSVSRSYSGLRAGVSLLVSVSLYDKDNVLLGQGSATMTVGAGSESVAPISITPTTSSTTALTAGPTGATIPANSNGKTFIYTVNLPAPGAYAATFWGDGLTAEPKVYASDGTPIAVVKDTPSSSRCAFTAASAGTYYAVATVPSTFSDSCTLKVNADCRSTVAVHSVYVDSTLAAVDPVRPITVSIPGGFNLASLKVLLSGVEQVFTYSASADGKTVTITLSSPSDFFGQDASLYQIAFHDALLNQAQTPITLDVPNGQFREVLYVDSSGSEANSGNWNGHVKTLKKAATLPTTSNSVIALKSGDVISELDVVLISSNPVAIVGGCDASWDRSSADRGVSHVALAFAFSLSGHCVEITKAASLYNLVLEVPAANDLLYQIVPIYLFAPGQTTLFRNCTIQASTIATRFSSVILLHQTTGNLELDRCTINCGEVTEIALSDCTLDALRITSTGSCVLANSVVYTGNLVPMSNYMGRLYGIHASATCTLSLIGSTVASGAIEYPSSYSTSNHANVPVYFDTSAGSTFYSVNSLMAATDIYNTYYPGDSYGVWWNVAITPTCQSSAFSLLRKPGDGSNGYFIRNNVPNEMTVETAFPSYTNYYVEFGDLLLANYFSGVSAAAVDLHLAGASSSYLANCGLDLSNAANQTAGVLGFAPSIDQQSELLLDRDGNMRYAGGYTIGAYR